MKEKRHLPSLNFTRQGITKIISIKLENNEKSFYYRQKDRLGRRLNIIISIISNDKHIPKYRVL